MFSLLHLKRPFLANGFIMGKFLEEEADGGQESGKRFLRNRGLEGDQEAVGFFLTKRFPLWWVMGSMAKFWKDRWHSDKSLSRPSHHYLPCLLLKRHE